MKRIMLIAATLLLCSVGCSQNKSVSKLLEGTWQNVEDETNFIVFEDGMRKEIVSGMDDWDSEKYTLSDFCTNETHKGVELQHEKDKYISCNKSDLCWYIVELNNESLILSFMGRGNTLEYKRVTKPDMYTAAEIEHEDFEMFLDRYNRDFEFQKSRTIFPFINEQIEYEEIIGDEGEFEYKEKIITKETPENEWTKIDFTWDSSYAERETDAYTQEIKTVGNTSYINYKGVENGINMQVVFVSKNKKWYLQKIIDSSM